MPLETKKKFRIISYALIIGGLTLMAIFALPILFSVLESEWNPQCYKELRCDVEGLEYGLHDNKGHLKTMIGGWLSFNTTGVFAESNPINYFVSIKVDNPQYVKNIFVLIDMNNKNTFDFFDDKPYNIIQTYLSNNFIQSIPLYYTKPNFFTNSNQTEFYQAGNVTFATLIVDDNDTSHITRVNGQGFTLKPYEDKIQSDQNIDDKRSSKVILLLTMMGVTLAPVMLGADFLGRINLND